MFSLPVILVLKDARVYICTLYGDDITSYIKATINQSLG